MSVEANPAFPAELEREMFELAAFLHPECMPSLLLVALRVKAWIEPILYRVVSLQLSSVKRQSRRLAPEAFKALLELRPAFLQKSVRHAWLMDLNPDSEPALSVCSAVMDLALLRLPQSDNDLLRIRALPLQRLFLVSIVPETVFTGPLFSGITHLSVFFYARATSQDWLRLAQIPHLTHLCFSRSRCPPSVCESILQISPRLDVLANVCDRRDIFDHHVPRYDTVGSCARFVMLLVPDYQTDWEAGARGGEDYWKRAERLVKRRSAGEIKAYHETGEENQI